MTKQETYDYLRAHGVDFEITEHKAVFNMEECADLHLPYPESEAKNLFIRDDKHAHYYLITVKADKRVNLKDFRRAHGTRPLTFASPEELLDLLKLTPAPSPPWGCWPMRSTGWTSSWTGTFSCPRTASASTPTTTPPPSGSRPKRWSTS